MNETQKPKSGVVLPVISIITFLGFIDSTILIPIMALYAADLGASVQTIGFIIGLYSISNTVASPIFGRLIDRIGYKPPLILGMVGDALGMFLYSVCRLPIQLALVRLFHGASGGMVGPATMSVYAELSEKTKGRTMSIYGISLAAATLFGFGLSGIFVSRLGYEALFRIGVIILVTGAALSFLLPGGKKRIAATESMPGGFDKIKGLFRRRGLIAAYTAIFAQYFTFGGVVTLLPVYIQSLGMEAFHMGMLLSAFAIAFIIIQFPSGALSDRIGRFIPTATGLSLGIISLALLPLLNSFLLLMSAMVLYGIAFGFLFPSISALVADHSSSEERGIATGVFHALLTVGVAIGAPVIGWVGGMAGVGPGLASISGVMLLALIVVMITLRPASIGSSHLLK